MAGARGTGVGLERLGRWSLVGLPQLNRSVLAGDLAPTMLVEALARHVLVDLPAAETFTPREAQQLLVHLGLSGASVARHFQEQQVSRRATPQLAFEHLLVGPAEVPFLTYFAQVAARTGTGHPGRDSYASLIKWNVPTCEVRWAGATLAVLPGVFDDGQVRTYTGDRGERLFFELTKRSEAVERAVNDLLEPLSERAVGLRSGEAMGRVRLATTLLTALRRLATDFGRLLPGAGLRADHFIDVFRQFAAHWEVDDIPPSGALDPESLKRDLLLGLDVPGYERHVRWLFPALLNAERADLSRLLGRQPLPDQVLESLRPAGTALVELSAAELRGAVREHPALAAWYLLLNEHARASGVHLALAKKFLFAPGRVREAAAVPDAGLVSRRHGTTGMDESLLERLARVRHNHVLSCLRQIPHLELVALAGIDPPVPVSSQDLVGLVRFADPVVRLSRAGPRHHRPMPPPLAAPPAKRVG